MKSKSNGITKQSAIIIGVSLLATVLIGAIAYYFALPSFNLKFKDIYFYAIFLAFVFCASMKTINALVSDDFYNKSRDSKFTGLVTLVVSFVGVLILVFLVIAFAFSSELFNAKKYSSIMNVETGEFSTDIKEVAYSKIPMLDSDSAQQIGSRKLGELSDLVSQYELMGTNNQINYNGHPVRLIGLQYADIFRWFNNHNNGIPGYIIVDMVTQQADVVRVDEGIRYSTAEMFGHDLMRYVQFKYPTVKFGTPVFELDDDGNPYWICPTLDNTIGLFGGTDVDGAVMVNAITGEYTRYSVDEVPTWVDRLYPASMLITQYDYYGAYKDGFWNSVFGKMGVTETTDGYNYVVIGDDVYVYTGVTSVTSDQSNIGFLLVNQRTKETKFYNVSGATESSAMQSAQSQVQQMDYVATFPLLLNIADQPTYFMSLKGYDGLVKMYAMVNVESYQIVETGKTVAECEQNYRKALANNGLIENNSDVEDIEQVEYSNIIGTIEDIRTVVMGGDSYYAIKLQDNEIYYLVKAADNVKVITANVGDKVSIAYESDEKAEDRVLKAYELDFVQG